MEFSSVHWAALGWCNTSSSPSKAGNTWPSFPLHIFLFFFSTKIISLPVILTGSRASPSSNPYSWYARRIRTALWHGARIFPKAQWPNERTGPATKPPHVWAEIPDVWATHSYPAKICYCWSSACSRAGAGELLRALFRVPHVTFLRRNAELFHCVLGVCLNGNVRFEKMVGKRNFW